MSPGSFITRFMLVIVLWVATHGYLAWKLLKPVRGAKRIALGVLVFLVAGIPPLTLYLDRTGAVIPMKDTLQWVGFGLVGFSSLLGFYFVTEDLVRLPWLPSRFRRRARTAPSFDADRRLFLRNSVNLGVVSVAGGVTAIEAGSAQDLPLIREVPIPLENLHPDLDGFRIVQVTDLHVGGTIRRDYVTAVAKAVNALSPDLIAVTGDLVDGQVAEWKDEVGPLRDLKAPHGVFFVTGNHEYYWDPLGWLDLVRGYGWVPLLNEHRVIERGAGRILLAGVTDYRSSRYVAAHVSDPAAARANAPPADTSILLAHQPRSIFEASKAHYDLQISGHTHGGQYFPVTLLVRLIEPYVSGLHRHENTWIYVSCGTGYWGPPLRLGVPKEITVLKLVRAA